MSKFRLGAIAVLALLGIATAFLLQPQPSGERPLSKDEIAYMSADAHIVVGDVPLVLPYVAMPRQQSMGYAFTLDRAHEKKEWKAERDAFRARTSDPATAPRIDQLEIVIAMYGKHHGYDAMCSSLSREWARSVCSHPWALLRQTLPRERFYLADDRRLEMFDNHYTLGRERVGDQLAAMTLASGETSIICDRTREAPSVNPACTAAMPVDRHLIAVWTVHGSPKETAAEQAVREGKAILTFITHGTGPSENHPELVRQMCAVLSPDAFFRDYENPCA